MMSTKAGGRVGWMSCLLLALAVGEPLFARDADVSQASAIQVQSSAECLLESGLLKASWIHNIGQADVLRGVLKTASGETVVRMEARLLNGGLLQGELFEVNAAGQLADAVPDAVLLGQWGSFQGAPAFEADIWFQATALNLEQSAPTGALTAQDLMGEITGSAKLNGQVGSWGARQALAAKQAAPGPSISVGVSSIAALGTAQGLWFLCLTPSE